jgi:hypothetical protein
MFLPKPINNDQPLTRQPQPQQQELSRNPHQDVLQVPIVVGVAVPVEIDAANTRRVEDDSSNSTGVIHLGRDAIIDDEIPLSPGEAPGVGVGGTIDNQDSMSLMPIPAPPQSFDQMDVSIRSLLRQMSLSSVNDYDLVNDVLLMDTRWVRLFATMSPEQYGLVIGHVKEPADQPEMAALLAEYVNGGGDRGGLTCIFVAAAVRKTEQSHRTTTVERLLPLCVDASTNYALIRQELNEWEQTVASVRNRSVR